MQEGEPGPAPRDEEVDEENSDIKTGQDRKDREYEEEDIEISEKKDRPPRFSTIFDPTPGPRVIERYTEPRRRSGVFLPTPLFVVLAIMLLFESTLLFAYTIIGLYNNLPHGLLPFGSSSTSVLGDCNCAGQPAINIAPNFIMPGANADAITATSDVLPLPDTTSSTTTKTSSSPSTTNSINKTAVAAGLLSALHGIHTTTSNPAIAHTVVVVTATPTRQIVSITSIETVIPGQSTSTSIVNVPAPSSSSVNAKRASPASGGVSSAETSGASAEGGTTLSTEVASKGTTTPAASPTTEGGEGASTTTTSAGAGGTLGACFGAGGAVFLNCV